MRQENRKTHDYEKLTNAGNIKKQQQQHEYDEYFKTYLKACVLMYLCA